MTDCPNPRCVDGNVPGGPLGDLLCPDCKGTPCRFFAVHRELLTTPDVLARIHEHPPTESVVIVYAPSETLPAIGDRVSPSRPDREVRDDHLVRVVDVVEKALVRGFEGQQGMRVNLVVAALEPEATERRSYPDSVTSPNDPPTVGGTEVTRHV